MLYNVVGALLFLYAVCVYDAIESAFTVKNNNSVFFNCYTYLRSNTIIYTKLVIPTTIVAVVFLELVVLFSLYYLS